MTAPTLYPHQSQAVKDVLAAWSDGVRRVCLVIPTGGGKTRTAVELAQRAPHQGRATRVLWIAHRSELLEQAAGKLREAGADVAIVSPAYPPDPWASMQVASIDTLVSRKLRPPADLVVWDECHHAAAETYARVIASYSDTLHLGLTATPQRRDGKPLGDHYDRLVVGAQYSELLAGGYLTPCRVRRPVEYLGSDIARSPLDEWREYGGDRLTFAFAPTVEQAHAYAAEFRAAGIAAECIEGKTSAEQRADMLARFRAGQTRVLWNVYVLTEGVDVPQASCCLLARGCGHSGTMLQIAGRVLRTSPGKADAIMLDMSGATHIHGLPTCDRAYSLTGRSIAVVGEALKNCLQCGAVLPSATPVCPDCGYVWAKQERRAPKVWDMELQWAIDAVGGDAAAVSEAHKRAEWDRLCKLVEARDFSLGFARKEYEKLFGEGPPAAWCADVGEGLRVQQLRKLLGVANIKGYKPGWVSYRFKAQFGRWPTKAETAAAKASLEMRETG